MARDATRLRNKDMCYGCITSLRAINDSIVKTPLHPSPFCQKFDPIKGSESPVKHSQYLSCLRTELTEREHANISTEREQKFRKRLIL